MQREPTSGGLNIVNVGILEICRSDSSSKFRTTDQQGGRLMRKAYAIVLAGLGAAAIAGAAAAASRDTHTMKVPLPDGSIARVEYIGDVAPKVTVFPDSVAPISIFDRNIFDMQRQIEAMVSQVDAMAKAPMAVSEAPAINVAAYGSLPEGSSSVTVVTTSIGAKTCTRTSEVTSQGSGKPPKVVTNVSGDCGAAPASTPATPSA
jgi:hypothetical protein